MPHLTAQTVVDKHATVGYLDRVNVMKAHELEASRRARKAKVAARKRLGITQTDLDQQYRAALAANPGNNQGGRSPRTA